MLPDPRSERQSGWELCRGHWTAWLAAQQPAPPTAHASPRQLHLVAGLQVVARRVGWWDISRSAPAGRGEEWAGAAEACCGSQARWLSTAPQLSIRGEVRGHDPAD